MHLANIIPASVFALLLTASVSLSQSVASSLEDGPTDWANNLVCIFDADQRGNALFTLFVFSKNSEGNLFGTEDEDLPGLPVVWAQDQKRSVISFFDRGGNSTSVSTYFFNPHRTDESGIGILTRHTLTEDGSNITSNWQVETGTCFNNGTGLN